MISNLRPTAILRCLRSDRIGPLALIACISLLVAPSADAGFLDQLKQQATQAIKKEIPHASPSQPSSPSGQANQTPAAAPSAATSQVPKSPNAAALVRKFRPIVPSYSGGPVDMLGVRLGMTLPQAEDIAKKTYSSSPRVVYAHYFFTYKEATVTSRPFVKYVRYTKTAANTADQLQLTFNSPVGDDRIVSMERLINFSDHAADEPLANTIQTSLIKKYGRPGENKKFLKSQVTLLWAFDRNSRLPCPDGSCFNHSDSVGQPTYGDNRGRMAPFARSIERFDLTSGSPFSVAQRESQCGAINPGTRFVSDKDSNNNVRIQATISLNQTDSSKVRQLEVLSYYIKPCLDALVGARAQMKAAAIQRYESMSKKPAAPSF